MIHESHPVTLSVIRGKLQGKQSLAGTHTGKSSTTHSQYIIINILLWNYTLTGDLSLHTQSVLLIPCLMSVCSPRHRTGDAAGSYGRWGHLFLCGVWIQGSRPSRPAIFSARLAVPRWWERLFVFFERAVMHSYTVWCYLLSKEHKPQTKWDLYITGALHVSVTNTA